MTDGAIQNWKEKYLSALEKFEASQQKDQHRMDILRRGLVRVSLAADGLDKQLDDQLAELRGALRGSQDITSLEPLLAELEQTVVTLDDRRKLDQEQLLALLDSHLEQQQEADLPRQDKSAIKKLRKQLPELIAFNGTNLDMWKNVQQVQGQIYQSLMEKIEEMSQHREGFLSRLFSHSDKKPDEATSATADDDTDFDAIDSAEIPASSAQIRQPTSTPTPQSADTAANDEDTDVSPDGGFMQRVGRIMQTLLDNVDVPTDYTLRKEQLLDRIHAEFTLDDLPEALDEAAQLVASTRLVAQKEFEGFLVALHQRLQDIQQFLETAKAGEEQSIVNQRKLDEDVRKELKDIRSSVEKGGDIGRLRLEIEGIVNRIVATVDGFHSDEKKRREDVFNRIESLAKRMESMEAEASELKSSLEAQRIEALKDALTELPNRAAYDDQIQREFSRWRRHGRPLSLCVVDIDFFKHINDSLGHLRGDKVLKLVAREISRRVRSEDFVARYGGEEFVIIMPETDQQSALAAAEKVRIAIAECPFNFNNERLVVTASFGVAAFEEGDEIDTCFERADKALYRAKSQGRNQVERG